MKRLLILCTFFSFCLNGMITDQLYNDLNSLHTSLASLINKIDSLAIPSQNIVVQKLKNELNAFIEQHHLADFQTMGQQNLSVNIFIAYSGLVNSLAKSAPDSELSYYRYVGARASLEYLDAKFLNPFFSHLKAQENNPLALESVLNETAQALKIYYEMEHINNDEFFIDLIDQIKDIVRIYEQDIPFNDSAASKRLIELKKNIKDLMVYLMKNIINDFSQAETNPRYKGDGQHEKPFSVDQVILFTKALALYKEYGLPTDRPFEQYYEQWLKDIALWQGRMPVKGGALSPKEQRWLAEHPQESQEPEQPQEPVKEPEKTCGEQALKTILVQLLQELVKPREIELKKFREELAGFQKAKCDLSDEVVNEFKDYLLKVVNVYKKENYDKWVAKEMISIIMLYQSLAGERGLSKKITGFRVQLFSDFPQ